MLTDDMKRVIAEQKLGFVATVDADGAPNLSPKGTMQALDDEHIIFADIRSPGTMANIARNPAMEINFVDPFNRKGYRFKGTARVVPKGTRVLDAGRTLSGVLAGRRVSRVRRHARHQGRASHLAGLRRRRHRGRPAQAVPRLFRLDPAEGLIAPPRSSQARPDRYRRSCGCSGRGGDRRSEDRRPPDRPTVGPPPARCRSRGR